MTSQPLPAYLSYSYDIDYGQYTVANVPQTYYGPSIPLGSGWAYGGSTSPTSTPSSTSSTASSTSTSSTSTTSSSSTSTSSSSSTSTSSSSTSTKSTSASSNSSSSTSPPVHPFPSIQPNPNSGESGNDTRKILAIVLSTVLGSLVLILLLLLLLCLCRRRRKHVAEKRQLEITPFLSMHQKRPSEADAALYSTEAPSKANSMFTFLGGISSSNKKRKERALSSKLTTLPPPKSRGFKTQISIEDQNIFPTIERQKHNYSPSRASIGTYDNASQRFISPLDKIKNMRLSMLSSNSNDQVAAGTSAGIWGIATSVFPRRSMRPQPPISGAMTAKRRQEEKNSYAHSYYNDSTSSGSSSSSNENNDFTVIPAPRIDDFYSNSSDSYGKSLISNKLFSQNNSQNGSLNTNYNVNSNSNSKSSSSKSSNSLTRPPFAYRQHNSSPSPSMSSLSQATHFSWLNEQRQQSPISFLTTSEGYGNNNNSNSSSNRSRNNGNNLPVFPRTSDTVFGKIIADRDIHDFGPPHPNIYRPIIVEEDENEDELDNEDEDARREAAMTTIATPWSKAKNLLNRNNSHQI